MTKLWVNGGGMPKPKGDLFYELAANGIFMHQKSNLWESVTQVSEIDGIKERNPELKLFLPPIPEDLVRDVIRFFAWVYKTHGTEVMVVLCYSPEEKKYFILVPSQSVSSGHISYNYKNEIKNRPKGYRLIGTIHSHCDFSAFHSGVDESDEAEFDGIHFTFGDFKDEKRFRSISVSGEAAICGTRFPLKILYWLSGMKTVKSKESFANSGKFFGFKDLSVILPESYKPNEEWVKKVKVMHKSSISKGRKVCYEPYFQSLKDEDVVQEGKSRDSALDDSVIDWDKESIYRYPSHH